MAEGLWNACGGGEWEAFSAGSRPTGFVHPVAIQAMAELGIDITGHRSKHIEEVTGQTFDLVVTVCDNAKEACSALPTVKQHLHWPSDDPAAVAGEIGKLLAFRRVRDEIRSRIRAYLSVQPDSSTP
jgi:arsenate reductase